ncbi:hypothetical protein SeLEV6574_g08636, partial [Synchytrium endobioticum]
MVKFITISLLAYAAAFLFFTPIRAGRQFLDDLCIHDMIVAAIYPDRGIHPLSLIRDRIGCIVSRACNDSKIKCSIAEVLETPGNIDSDRISPLRRFHESVFNDLTILFQWLTQAIRYNDNIRPTLEEAQALVFFGINWHCDLVKTFRELHKSRRLKGRLPRTELALPLFEWAIVEKYVNEDAYLELIRSAVSETPGALPAQSSSSPALPVNSGIGHDAPDSGYDATVADTSLSESQKALPDPSSLDSCYDHIRNQNDEGPDFGYVPPHGRAPMFDSTNPGIQLSDGYNDPQYYPYDTEFALPAH